MAAAPPQEQCGPRPDQSGPPRPLEEVAVDRTDHGPAELRNGPRPSDDIGGTTSASSINRTLRQEGITDARVDRIRQIVIGRLLGTTAPSTTTQALRHRDKYSRRRARLIQASPARSHSSGGMDRGPQHKPAPVRRQGTRASGGSGRSQKRRTDRRCFGIGGVAALALRASTYSGVLSEGLRTHFN